MSNMEIKSEIGREQEKVQSMMEQNSIRKAELNQRILSNKSQVSSALEEMQKEEKALEEMSDRARELGANAVVGIDIDYEALGADNGMLMATASGTAVVID